jgi:magnesium-transporting ATPase (P-type)
VHNTYWRSVTVGDFVLLENNERIPADMIVIGTSSEDGRCYMETSTLDGEKNLKPRESIKKEFDYMTKIKIEDGKVEMVDVDIHMRVKTRKPSYVLYEFDGHIEFYDKEAVLHHDNPVVIEAKNLLLKGAKLKNTQWVVGLVLYTGNDTKIQLNATSAKFKMTKMESRLHKAVVAILIAQTVIAIFAAFGRDIITKVGTFNLDRFLKFVGNPQDTINGYDTAVSNLIDGIRYFLLLNTMIPISLVVTLEVVRLLQTVHMRMSYSLYNNERDIPCKVNTSTVNEELGEIEYILTDKTGTLTQNKMILKGLFIGDQIFGGSFQKEREDADRLEFVSFKDIAAPEVRPSERINILFDRNLHNIIQTTQGVRLRKQLVISNKELQDIDIVSDSSGSKGHNLSLAIKKAEEGHEEPNPSTVHSPKERDFDTLRVTPAKLFQRNHQTPLTISEKSGTEIAERGEAKIDGASPKKFQFYEDAGLPNPDLPNERIPNEPILRPGLGTTKLVAVPDQTSDKQSFLSAENLNDTSFQQSEFSMITKETHKEGFHFGLRQGALPDIWKEGSEHVLLTYQQLIAEFFLCAVTCHECIVDRTFEGDISYLGPSPDEIAICKGARDIGCIFNGSDSSGKKNIKFFGQDRSVSMKMVD